VILIGWLGISNQIEKNEVTVHMTSYQTKQECAVFSNTHEKCQIFTFSLVIDAVPYRKS
jgi:hypothetical protein